MAKKKKKQSASGRSGGAKRALCVGINNYPGTESDLQGCVNDARDWKIALEARGFSVNLLLDDDATYSRIYRSLHTLVDGAKKGDTLVFTFSGHGSWLPDDDGDEADARDEMLCPYDVAQGAYLMDDELAEIFGRKAEGVRLFFISDSCHSGTVARFAPPLFPDAAKHHPRPRFLPPATFVKGRAMRARIERAAGTARASRQKYPALLAAGCKDTEYSYDASFQGRPNGAFTYFALRALKQNPKTLRAWIEAVRANLPSSVHPQSPSLFGSRTAKSGAMF